MNKILCQKSNNLQIILKRRYLVFIIMSLIFLFGCGGIIPTRSKRERGKLKSTGKREKYFLTRFGDILYSRTPYQDRQGKSHYLLDEALSIDKNQRISLSRGRIENFLSSLSSYREVVTKSQIFTDALLNNICFFCNIFN